MKTEGGEVHSLTSSLFYPETWCNIVDKDEIHDDSDRLSQLCDDVLISIISRLPLKEATSASILSTRWRHLHTYSTRLDFPAFQETIGYWQASEIRDELNLNYLIMVDGVLRSHRGSRVKEMKVHMPDIKGAAAATVANWFEFAVSRGVETLDISVLNHNLVDSKTGNYFPPRECCNIRLEYFNYCIRELSLDGVQFNDQECELLISNFVALETLRIHRSWELRKVVIVGHPKLKHLDISHGCRIESMEIRDLINLIILRCHDFSRECVLLLQNLPNLTQFTNTHPASKYECAAAAAAAPHDLDILAKIPSCIRDQLQLLRINVIPPLGSWYPPIIPQFVNTKHMELEMYGIGGTLVYQLFDHLIEACPSLVKLKIKLLWSKLELREKIGRRQNDNEPALVSVWRRNKASPNLKVVEITGFWGSIPELELAKYITEHVVALEEFIVVPDATTLLLRRHALARVRRHLKQITPPSVKYSLIISNNMSSLNVKYL